MGGYFDLRWRLNPVEATFHGLSEFDALFPAYDAESVREQLAALVAYENAIEEAVADSLAEEIDRTAVLHSLRHDMLLLGKERQFVHDPSYHLMHAVNGIFLLLARTPAAREGWALYCESLMAEMGFLDSAEERFFQAHNLLWRALRVILDVSLHTKGLSTLDAAARLREELGFEPNFAEAEAKRYCAYPTYQLC